jgi:hypothetical protein
VSGTPTIFQYLWVDALSVVTDNETENVSVVTYLSFNLLRPRMAEGIAKQFSPDSTDFIPDHRRQASTLAFHD